MGDGTSLAEERLERFRKKLLDTTRRNRLVNFRTHTTLGNRPIEKVIVVKGGDPDRILSTLVTESRRMGFLGVPDRRDALELDLDGPDASAPEPDPTTDSDDGNLSTELTRSRLERNLTKIRRDQIEMIEEQGVNALFLTLGQLQWFEADHSRERRLSPLILIPAVLDRTERGAFKLRWDGTDIGTNLSLGALLNEEFGIELPAVDGEEPDVQGYFTQVEGAVVNQEGWGVDRTAVNLGFFSFARYLIYKDLAPSSWPEDRLILSHEILNGLLVDGFAGAEDSLPEDTFLDDHRPIGETNEVFDADGSQTLAILQALKGNSMVIEGPPGTGKSQTIANLIAEFVSQGKKVLFVSEKGAALNVVYGRLKNAGLTGACLELHGTKANKRSFYQHLKDTIEQAAPRLVDSEALLRSLGAHRDDLNRYVHELHRPLPKRGLSPRETVGRLVQLGTEADTLGRFDRAPMSGWGRGDFEAARDAVESLQQQLNRIGSPLEHPFFGSERTYISPDDKAELARAIAQAKTAFDAFAEGAASLTARLNLEVPKSMDDVESLDRIVTFVLDSPDYRDLDFSHDAWHKESDELIGWVDQAEVADDLRRKYANTIAEQGWYADIKAILELLEAPGDVRIAPERVDAWHLLDEAEQSAHELIRIASKISQTLSMKMPGSLWAMEPLAHLALRISCGPDCSGLQLDSNQWHSKGKAILGALSDYQRSADLSGALRETVRLDCWSTPVDGLILVLERDNKRFFWRLLGREYKEARQKALGLLIGPAPSVERLVNVLKSIREVQTLETKIAGNPFDLQAVFGERWRGPNSDFGALTSCAEFLEGIHADIECGAIPKDILKCLYRSSAVAGLSGVAGDLRAATEQCSSAMERLHSSLEELSPGHSLRLSGDPRERLFRYVQEVIFAARLRAEALFTPGEARTPWIEVVKRLTACQRVRDAETTMASVEHTMSACLGSRFKQRPRNWEELRRLIRWASDLIRSVEAGDLPGGLMTFLQNQPPMDGLGQQLADFRVLRAVYASHIDSVFFKAQISGGADNFTNQDLGVQRKRIAGWASGVDDFEEFLRFNALAQRCSELGVPQAPELALTWPNANTRLALEFERGWCNMLVEEAIAERPVLRDFDRVSHEAQIESFRNLDRLLIAHNRARVSTSHWRSVPRSAAVGELGFLRMQMSRQRGHRPIRTAMREAPSAVQAIKPVFLMSPMSVAMYLPPEGPLFDVVLFDEASQIKPEDALGSVVRAKQIIVVGDTMQMPPTSFFDRITATEDLDEEDLDDIESADIADQESILAFASVRIPEGSPCRRDLRWHYRSRHEDLIKTSNRLFYKDRLVIFPHPERSGGEAGLILRHLPDTTYGRGNSRKNVAEARAVAEAALQHVRAFPTLSLGLVAFSKAQQEAIADEVDLLRRQDPAFTEFDKRHWPDELFIKNLESVQGDERDAIFISVGYGRDENGFLAMSFGPLARDGGERRLNVLITRARVRTVVFCNFRASDMRMAESRCEGVKALHTFLAFAESGHLDVVPAILPQEPSYFEECVYEQLRNRGYEVDKQVGSEGFYIDLAVRHPAQPGRYVLGIECDGAMYHSARSARDRDRLRQQVLEDRGWKIHRIWSTDWWRHPARELDRCCAAIDLLVSRREPPTEPPATAPLHDAGEVVTDEPAAEAAGGDVRAETMSPKDASVPYVRATLPWPFSSEIVDMPPWQLATYVRQVVDAEAPVHVDEIVSRIREAAGKARAGRLIREHLLNSIFAAGRQGLLELRGGFAYTPGQSQFVARSRSSLPPQAKKIECVAPEEILQAALDIVEDAIAVEVDEMSRPVCYRLGFDRVTIEMARHVDEILDGAARQGKLGLAAGKFRQP